MLKILHEPDVALHGVCAPVSDFGPEVLDLARALIETLNGAGGAGLAAPQVGLHVRMILMAVPGDDVKVLVNPVLVHGWNVVATVEGCLSLPKRPFQLLRFDNVGYRGQDTGGNAVEGYLQGFSAHCFQHECDHLDGTLISDKGRPFVWPPSTIHTAGPSASV